MENHEELGVGLTVPETLLLSSVMKTDIFKSHKFKLINFPVAFCFEMCVMSSDSSNKKTSTQNTLLSPSIINHRGLF